VPSVRLLSCLALIAIASSCGADVTEVVVVVSAEDPVATRARYLAVRVFDTDGSLVVDRVDEVPGEVTFPARIPLTPRDGDATRNWRVEVDAQTAFGCVFSNVEAEGGYTDGFAESRELTLSPISPEPCPLGPGCMGDCDDGLPCTMDSCVEERCLNQTAPGSCAIDGACLTSGARSGSDSCLVCDPDSSGIAWSLAPGCDSGEVARLDDGATAASRYGQAVAIADDVIVVGAPEANAETGQAFAFRHDAAGAWVYEGELTPRDLAAGAQLGFDVDVSGQWALVGAPYDGAGRVLSFRRDSIAGWVPDQELTSSMLDPADRFGSSVAIDGNLAVVGATHVEGPIMESGAVWVFRRNAEGRWVDVAYVESPDPQAEAYFGNAVALSGDRFVVGSLYRDEGAGENTGGAYVYQITGDTVSDPITLTPSHVQTFGYFGHEVAIEGTRVAVAATQDDTFGSDGGAVYVFEIEGDAAPEVAQIGMGPAGAQAGLGLAVGTSFVIVGFPYYEDGFVTLFEEADGRFTGLPRILASDMAPSASFGRSVATWDRWMVIGAPNPMGSSDPGAFYIHELRR
jgi:hypothetical protein